MKAYEILETKGWCQGRYTNDQDQHCLMGAITMRTDQNLLPRNILVDRIASKLNRYDLASWNDEPGRTAAEVIALLKSVEDENHQPQQED